LGIDRDAAWGACSSGGNEVGIRGSACDRHPTDRVVRVPVDEARIRRQAAPRVCDRDEVGVRAGAAQGGTADPQIARRVQPIDEALVGGKTAGINRSGFKEVTDRIASIDVGVPDRVAHDTIEPIDP
jgi:hypothetical protein